MAEKNYTEYERDLRDFEKKPLAKDRETLIFPPESDIKGSDDQDASVLPAAPKLSMRKEAVTPKQFGYNALKESDYKALHDDGTIVTDFLDHCPICGSSIPTGGEAGKPYPDEESEELLVICPQGHEWIIAPAMIGEYWYPKSLYDKEIKEASKKISVNDKILTSTKKKAKVVKVSDDLIFWVSVDGEKDFGSDFAEDIELFEGHEPHEPFERHRRERGHEPIDEGITKEIPMEETIELASKNRRKKKAGTWALPFTPAAATTLESIVSRLTDNDISVHEAKEEIYGAYGDDKLSDDLDELEKSISLKAAEVIRDHVSNLLGHYDTDPEDFEGELDLEAKEILERI